MSHVNLTQVRRGEDGKIEISFASKGELWAFIKQNHPDFAEQILAFKKAGIDTLPPTLWESESFLSSLGYVITV